MSKKVKLSPVHLQYWCKTSLIDEIVCQRRNIVFDKKLADHLEQTVRHYFVVDKAGNYKVVSGVDFEVYFNDKNVELKDRVQAPEIEKNGAAEKAIELFMKEVHGV